jgi:hypothetical protein
MEKINGTDLAALIRVKAIFEEKLTLSQGMVKGLPNGPERIAINEAQTMMLGAITMIRLMVSDA